nr:reverse transcriptase domain-containing protein [Tanacetum cinerariifolium]
MTDNHTMEELLQAPTEGYGEAIVIPEINADHFEIKMNLLQLVQVNPYHGFERENPHTHINNFKRITSTLKFRDVPNDVIKLMMFSYSLEGNARVCIKNQSSTSGTLPSNTIPNPKGEMKAITIRSGVSYEGPSIPTPKKTLPKPNIPYPSRLNDQKLREKATNQMEKFFHVFQDLHFDISFADTLLLMPKFASTIKSLLTNKDKFFELAKIPLNENCLAMLLKNLPGKLGDPGNFLIYHVISREWIEEYAQEILGFSSNSSVGNPTSTFEPILSVSSPSLTPFKRGDFILEEIDAYLKDELISPEINHADCDSEGDICLIEKLKLNDATRKDHFPLPFMDQMLQTLAGNEFYYFLDGFFGYFRIPINLPDQEKTTFTCPYGTFAYRRMPFGLCNALGTFQRCMMAIFNDMIEKTIEVFMDDFSVFEDSFSSRLSLLDTMLQSDFAISVVLGKCKMKHFQPIHYASKTITEAQIHYTTAEKEMLFVVYAFEKFQPYLVLSKSIVYTDHSALKYLLRTENLAADHLSRLENPQKDVFENKDINENFPSETLGKISSGSTPWFADFANFHARNFIVKGISSQQKKKFFKDVKHYFWDDPYLFLRPFTITKVFPYGTVELSQPDGPNFKVNGHRMKHYFGGDVP